MKYRKISFLERSSLLLNRGPEAIDCTLNNRGEHNIQSEKRALVFDIQRFAVHDGPGIRTLMFFKGCPLRCWWCQNPESQRMKKELAIFSKLCIACMSCIKVCPQKAISVINDVLCIDRGKCNVCGDCEIACSAGARKIIGREMNILQIFEEVRKDKPFYDRSKGGVTLSGGEPIVWADSARDLLELCLQDQINTAVETCGYVPWDKIKMLAPVTGLFLYDLKCMDDGKHREYTGVSNKPILDNLIRLSGLTDSIIIRIPIIPNLNDSPKNITETARFVKGLKVVKEIDLLPYHQLGASKHKNLGRTYKLKELSPPSNEKMAELRDIILSYGIECIIEG